MNEAIKKLEQGQKLSEMSLSKNLYLYIQKLVWTNFNIFTLWRFERSFEPKELLNHLTKWRNRL